jgi:hypothetical protein
MYFKYYTTCFDPLGFIFRCTILSHIRHCNVHKVLRGRKSLIVLAYCPSYRRPHMHGIRYTCRVVAAQHYAALPLSRRDRRDGPNASSLVCRFSACSICNDSRLLCSCALVHEPVRPASTDSRQNDHTALASGPHVSLSSKTLLSYKTEL